MVELKTIKDLDLRDSYIDGGLSEVKEQIKAEAIKYINIGGSFDKLIKSFIKDRFEDNLSFDDLEEFACEVLQFFCNITKDDLK